MNIDVREYLRINPISVHELSVSDNDTDCFLFFPSESGKTGYRAFTQRMLFKALIRTIFGNLVVFDQEGNASISDDLTIPLGIEKFGNYVKREDVEAYMYGDSEHPGKEQEIQELGEGLDDIILALRRKGILDYAGAVELQSNNTRKLEWTSSDGEISGPLYKDMSYAEGQIWCKNRNSKIDVSSGVDEVMAGDQPAKHNHPVTKAETMTRPLVNDRTGGKLVGDFAIGSRIVVSQGKGENYGAEPGSVFNPVEASVSETLTYPLYGQNVLDWRNPKKTHNNVPPCLNIYVRYLKSEQRGIASRQPHALEEQTSYLVSYREAVARIDQEISQARDSTAEAKYHSSLVGDLTPYSQEDLTTHDCLLRVGLDPSGNPQLFRQTVKMLLDIFTDKTRKELSTEEATMAELLQPHFDKELMLRSEFVKWYAENLRRIKAIAEKIRTARELMVCVPPVNYVGRIIVTTTDDTEQKVVANYGGKHWRRIENFLRGVDKNDPEIGRKWGEEYVELRESNVPVHQHQSHLNEKATTKNCNWDLSDKSDGETKVVNSNYDEHLDLRKSIGLKNVPQDYQMSPLEYAPNYDEDAEEGKVTLPHDNMPPYLNVYIWECVEISDEERVVTGEPKPNKFRISWICGQSDIRTTDKEKGTPISNSEIPSGYAKWKGMSGGTYDRAELIGKTVTCNQTYAAV